MKNAMKKMLAVLSGAAMMLTYMVAPYSPLPAKANGDPPAQGQIYFYYFVYYLY